MNISGPSAPLLDDLVRLLQRRVIAVVEADAHAHVAGARRREQRIDLGDGAAGRLLDDDVLAGVDGRLRDRRQRVVGGRDDHDVHVRRE